MSQPARHESVTCHVMKYLMDFKFPFKLLHGSYYALSGRSMPHEPLSITPCLTTENHFHLISFFVFFLSLFLTVLRSVQVTCARLPLYLYFCHYWYYCFKSCSIIYFRIESSVSSIGNVVFFIKSGNWFVVY